ncbi:MAG: hypothetical protein QM702_03565 [Rubrivivax sp.]
MLGFEQLLLGLRFLFVADGDRVSKNRVGGSCFGSPAMTTRFAREQHRQRLFQPALRRFVEDDDVEHRFAAKICATVSGLAIQTGRRSYNGSPLSVPWPTRSPGGAASRFTANGETAAKVGTEPFSREPVPASRRSCCRVAHRCRTADRVMVRRVVSSWA